jgi:hypothetical protein
MKEKKQVWTDDVPRENPPKRFPFFTAKISTQKEP